MAETAFLRGLEAYLGGLALMPNPISLGPTLPTGVGELPAVVLSLESTKRSTAGLGSHSDVQHGALRCNASIDLANPVLPSEPDFRLLSPDRQELVLPHGGLVRADGAQGTITAADLSVRVGRARRTVVEGTPSGNEVGADASVGKLTFASPLPARGTVNVEYFVGQWERRVESISGILRVEIFGGSAGDVSSLSDGVVEALSAPEIRRDVLGLVSISVQQLGAIESAASVANGARQRAARFSFRFERFVDRPASSGGEILQVLGLTHISPIESGLSPETTDPETDVIAAAGNEGTHDSV